MSTDLRLPCLNCGHFEEHNCNDGCLHAYCECDGYLRNDSPEGRFRAACEEALRLVRQAVIDDKTAHAAATTKWEWATAASQGAAIRAQDCAGTYEKLREVYLSAQKTRTPEDAPVTPSTHGRRADEDSTAQKTEKSE